MDQLTKARAFAETLTADLRAVSHDKQYWTALDLSGKRYPKKPVYVLTSTNSTRHTSPRSTR